ncbi:hypothetical protein GCM10009680_86940 [Streptomyces yatensis]|uniref:Uncharacterized protein n=2 Tax=Streptomyces yatensis TaxID=155177 RepID=A0ABP4VQI5_9ACTN
MTRMPPRAETQTTSRDVVARGRVGAHALPPLVPYVPPMAREPVYCPCGRSGPTAESLCRPCRQRAVEEHGARLAGLLAHVTYDHRAVRLSWTGPDDHPSAFTPRVHFTAPDVLDPYGATIALRWFDHWADGQLIAACAAGADDEHLLALSVAQAHYALATLAVHEVGEWYTYRGHQVYPPHRPDPYLPHDEDGGPDGNGQVVLWLTYGGASGPTGDKPRASAIPCVAGRPVNRDDIGTLPGQTLILAPHAITVTPPRTTRTAHTPWTNPRDSEDPVELALRDIHQAMVMSELSVVAAHLHLSGAPVLAQNPDPRQGGDGIAWAAFLTYDG